MTEHKRLVENIQTRMAFYVSNLRISNDRDYFDENKEAEYFFCKPLSLLFDADVTNANSERRNFPGIDLADKKEGICFQITSTNTKKKVQHTLDEFLEHKLDDDFDRLIVLIVTLDTPPKCASLRFDRPFDFDVTRDVWNISRLVQEFAELPADKRHLLQAFSDYLDQELPGIEAQKQHLELPLYSTLQASGFVGRQPELDKVRSRFAQKDKLVVLTGLGGIGKSELAVQYGREHKGRVYYAPFDGSFTRTLANMAQGIRPALSTEQLRQGEEILNGMVLKLLEGSDENDLLIIDNANSPTGVLAELQKDDCYQVLCKCPLRLLLTTRSTAPRAIGIGAMPGEPLFEIFRKHGTNQERSDMEALIKEVNGHTLTVDLIARTLAGGGLRTVTAEMMLKSLRENTLPSEKYRKIATDYNQSTEQAQIYQHLSTVFDLSHMSDEEKTLLSIATLFPENGIDGNLIADIVSEQQAECFQNLIDRGWLEKKGELLTIHPVIRLVCRTEIPPMDERCDAFLDCLTKRYDKYNYQQNRYRQMAEVLTNASRFLEDIEGAWALDAGVLWSALGASAKALECNLYAMRHMEAHFPPEHPALAAAYNNVGNTYGDLGDHHKALEYNLKALEILKRTLPAGHPALASSYNDTGVTFSKLGDYHMALEYKRKALAIMESTLPPESPELAMVYNNVGADYSDLGDHRKALEYLLKALQIRENVLSPEHPDLASTYDNMGISCNGLGDHTGALEHMSKALQIRKKVLSPEHPELAASYDNLGLIYSALGDHHKALKNHLKALKLRTKALPPKHPHLATSYNNLGVAYGNKGELHKSLEYKLKALELMERIFAPEHPVLASYYDNVGIAYGELGEHKKALKYKLRALKIMENVLPPDHPDLAMCCGNIGITYGDLGAHEKELEYKLRSLEIMEHSFPPEHPHLASAYCNLAAAYQKLDNLPAAAQYMHRASDIISRSSLPEDHPDRANFPRWAEQLEQEAKMQQAMMEQLQK